MDNNFRVAISAFIKNVDLKTYETIKKKLESTAIKISLTPEIGKNIRQTQDEIKKRIEKITAAGGGVVGKSILDPRNSEAIRKTTLEYRTQAGVIKEVWELEKKKNGEYGKRLVLKERSVLPDAMLKSEKDMVQLAKEEIELEKRKTLELQKQQKEIQKIAIAEEKSEERLKKQTQTLIDRSRLKQAGFTSKIESGKYTPESMAPAQKLYSQLESTTAAAGLIKPENLDKYNAAIKRLHTEIGIAEKGFVRVKKESQSFGDSLKSKVSNLLQYASASAILFGALQQLQQGVQYIKELNKAMTDIQIVSGATSQEVDSMVVGFNELAKEVGATTLEVAEGSLQWYRQGKSAADTALLLRNSMMMSKLAGIESAEATDYMTSIMNGFNLTAEETTEVLDKLTALDNASATSTAITFGGTHSNMGIIQLWYN